MIKNRDLVAASRCVLNGNKHLLAFIFLFLGMRSSAQTTFYYTGAMQTYTVPTGVSIIGVDMQGGKGGNSYGGAGGAGGRTRASINVTPGNTIYVFVAGAGPIYLAQDTVSGGFGGGGAAIGGGDGGGASDIRIGGMALSNRVIVAGGGGGGGDDFSSTSVCDGGGGGGLTGGNGLDCGIVDSGCGLGGTQTAGGAGADSGKLGFGGNYIISGHASGGGGGGGYYGGGAGIIYYGGCSGSGGLGGGGGGSSYADSSAIGVVMTAGYNDTGNGIVKIFPYPLTVQMLQGLDVRMFPNPATNQVMIEGAEGCEVRVYDMMGNNISVILSLPKEGRGGALYVLQNKQQIDISALNTGVYMVEILKQETGERVVRRLVKL